MPKIIDHDQRRDEISDFVLEIISERGVAGVTLRGVAVKSNWSTGVISHYFGNRDGLLVAALRRSVSIEKARQKKIFLQNGPETVLNALLLDSLPIDPIRVAIAKTFMFFYIEGIYEEHLRTETSGYFRAWIGVIHKALRVAREGGALCDHLELQATADDLGAVTWGMSVNMIVDTALLDRVDSPSRVTSWIANLAECKACATDQGAQLGAKISMDR